MTDTTDSVGRTGRRRAHPTEPDRDARDEGLDAQTLTEAPVDPEDDDHDAPEESPRRGRGPAGRAGAKGKKTERGKKKNTRQSAAAAGKDRRQGGSAGGATRARRGTASGSAGADPVSQFSASALRRVTVLGDRPNQIVHTLAEQSRRKRGTMALGTLLGLCIVSLLALLGVLVYQLMFGVSGTASSSEAPILEPPEGHSTLLPELYKGQKEDEVFAPIAERPQDAEPLTEEQVFGSTEQLELGDFALNLGDSGVTDNCTALVWGENLATTLADGGCTSAASGVYHDADDEYVAQFTLFDLEDSDAAVDAATAIDPTDHSTEPGFVLPPDTETQGLHDGYSEASTQVMGHYLAVYWVARADGGEPEDGDALSTVNVVAMNASVSVYEEVRDAKKSQE